MAGKKLENTEEIVEETKDDVVDESVDELSDDVKSETSESAEVEEKSDNLDVEIVDSLEETLVAKTDEESDDELDEKADDPEEEEVLVAKTDDDVEDELNAEVDTKDTEAILETLVDVEVETKDAAFSDIQVKRLVELGIEEKDINEAPPGSFYCAETKSLRTEPCDDCAGGCAPEGDLPGLLDVEARAMADFKGGEIVASGFAPNEAMFFVDVKREDGKMIEAAYANDGEALGWYLLDGNIAEKTGDPSSAITMNEAEEIALKQFQGQSYGVETAIFEGLDTYVVEIDADGKSYDVFITLDGEIAGWESYEFAAEDADTKAAMPAAAAPKPAAAAPAAAPKPAGDDKKLAEMIGTVTDKAKLKAVIDAIGPNDIPNVPATIKDAIVKKANELGAADILPAQWKAPAAPAGGQPSDTGKSLRVQVNGEEDPEFSEAFTEFQKMIAEESE